MVNIFVDPVIIMTPTDNQNRADVEVWIDNLDIWLKEALTSPYIWLHSVQATDHLQSDGRFPGFTILRDWQRRYQLDINPVQLAKNVNEFFRNEDFDLKHNLYKLEFDFEVEAGSVSIIPVQFTDRWPDSILEDMHWLLIANCVSKCLNHYISRNLQIATLKLPHAVREIEVSAIIVESLPDFPREVGNKITQTFPLLFTPDDLLPIIDVIELWDKGEKGLSYAIEHQFKKDWRENVPKPLKFHIGSGFIESVNKAGLDTNDTILRRIVKAAAAVIADQAEHSEGYQFHKLRESKAADSPQHTRSRDNAKAWRLMIGKRGAGWRMHYWQIPTQQGSIIEFSNVVKESDVTIYE
jgi:hypothetical protein